MVFQVILTLPNQTCNLSWGVLEFLKVLLAYEKKATRGYLHYWPSETTPNHSHLASQISDSRIQAN